MVTKKDKRLCWNCDGSVSLELTQCPYCGVYLEELPPQDVSEKKSEESAASYPITATDEEWNEAIDHQEETNEESTEKKLNSALLLILPGATFVLFGLLLLVFSKDGVLTLKWKGNFAYFYLTGAAALLYLGWRSLKKQK